MRILEFSGTHREVGRAHGEALREAFAESLAERLELCVTLSAKRGRELSPEEIRALAGECLPHLREFSPELHEELEGIAEGAGAGLDEVMLVGGYTDIEDSVSRIASGAGCTTCYVAPGASTDGSAYVAQTWDMYSGAEKGLVGLRLKVEGEPECFAFSYAGCVGMMGMNAQGLALGANKVTPTDGQAGVPWTFICRAILASGSAAGARAVFDRVRLCGGHHFLIVELAGKEVHSVETTGASYAEVEVNEPTYVHTNHYLDAGLKEIEAPRDPGSSTGERYERMDAILREGRGRIDRPFLEEAFSDHEGAPLSVCTHDRPYGCGCKISSCGAIIMNPGRRELAAVSGNPCQGEWKTLSFG